jgi:hypothetical protein
MTEYINHNTHKFQHNIVNYVQHREQPAGLMYLYKLSTQLLTSYTQVQLLC